METFDFGTFRLVVRHLGYSGEMPFWRITLEVPGRADARLELAAEGSSADAALGFVQDLRRMVRIGLEKYAAAMSREMGVSAAAVKATAAPLHESAAAVGDSALAAAEAKLTEARSPEAREAEEHKEVKEAVNKLFRREFDFGTSRMTVFVKGLLAPQVVVFIIRIEGPGDLKHEESMMRPPQYLLSDVAADHLKVIRFAVTEGIPATVARHMRANFISDQHAHLARKHVEKLAAVGQAIGLDEIDRMIALLDAESDRESLEREEITYQALEREERELAEQIRALRARRRSR